MGVAGDDDMFDTDGIDGVLDNRKDVNIIWVNLARKSKSSQFPN